MVAHRGGRDEAEPPGQVRATITRMERTSGGCSAPSRATASATSRVAGVGRKALDEGRQLRHAHPPGHEIGGAEVGKGDVEPRDLRLESGLSRRRLHPSRGGQLRDGFDRRIASYQAGGAQPRRTGGLLDGLLGRVRIVVGVGRGEDGAAGPRHPPRLPQAGCRIDEVVDREGRDDDVERTGPQRQRERVGGHHRRAIGAHGGQHAGREVGRDRPAARGADRHAWPHRCPPPGRGPGGPGAGSAIGPRARRPAVR